MLANSTDNVNPKNVKSDIEFVAEVISVDVARRLVECYPGVELRIPMKIKKTTHHLVTSLGMRNAKALCRYAGADTIHVPRFLPYALKPKDAQSRNEIIRELVLEGVSRREIALKLGLTQRHVRRLINSMGLSYETGNRAYHSKPTSISRVSNAPLTGHEANKRHSPPQNTKLRSTANSGGKGSRYGFANIQSKEIAT